MVATMPFVKAETVVPTRMLQGAVEVQFEPMLSAEPEAETPRTFASTRRRRFAGSTHWNWCTYRRFGREGCSGKGKLHRLSRWLAAACLSGPVWLKALRKNRRRGSGFAG